MQTSICAEMQMNMNNKSKSHHHHLWGTHTHVGIIPNPTDALCLNPKHCFTRQEPTAQLLDSRLFGANAFAGTVNGHRISENQPCALFCPWTLRRTQWNGMHLKLGVTCGKSTNGVEASAGPIRPTQSFPYKFVNLSHTEYTHTSTRPTLS